MAAVKDVKTNGAGFSNVKGLVRVVYDFSKDAGAVGSLDLLVADSTCLVSLVHAAVKTAVTGAAMTLSCGKAAGGVEFMSAVAVASLTLNSLHVDATPAPLRLVAGEKIDMTIGTAVATAGKVEFVFEIVKY